MPSGNLAWVKSSYSGSQGGNCVEVAADQRGRVLIRDTKNRAGAVLAVPADRWLRFAADIKNGLAPSDNGGPSMHLPRST